VDEESSDNSRTWGVPLIRINSSTSSFVGLLLDTVETQKTKLL